MTIDKRIGPIMLAVAAVLLLGAIIYAANRARTTGVVSPAPTASVQSDADTAIEALRQRADSNPKDAGAAQALGEALFQAQRFQEAAGAFEQATKIDAGNATHWSALGEARVMASARDPMPAAALAAFQKAHAIDPKDPRSRYFLAVARDLRGDHQGAIGDWLALLKETPPGAPWEADLRRTIEQVGKINKIDVAEKLAAIPSTLPHAPIAGPDADQIRAAAALPPGQQDAMARGMVESLEGKLKANPANLDGWVMLMRSRMTLGEPGKARAALQSAVTANPAAKARLESEAAAIGVPNG